MDTLEDIRRRINGLDAQIAELFEQRMRESRNVFEFKKANGLPIADNAREAEVIRVNSARISDDELREYYISFSKNLMSLSRDYQRKLMEGMRIAYSGVPGAFGYIAATRMFPNATYVSFSDFAEAYNACVSGDCDATVLPFENSFAGEVSGVTDLMFSGDLHVNQVMAVSVEHCLMSVPGSSLDSVRTVYSHPQALSQCEPFLRSHGYEVKEYSNTAEAAKMVAELADPTVAAIASVEAAGLYGLEVLESRINSSAVNTTRFAAFTRTLNKVRDSRKMGKHFILMFTVKNEAGSLAKTLNIIGSHNFNMTNLHSRPMKTLMWNYYFFMELEGDIASADGADMLKELSTICDRLKLVGSFNNA